MLAVCLDEQWIDFVWYTKINSFLFLKNKHTKNWCYHFENWKPFFKFLRLNEFLIPEDYFFLISELFLFLQFITKKKFQVFLKKNFLILKRKGSLSNGNSTAKETGWWSSGLYRWHFTERSWVRGLLHQFFFTKALMSKVLRIGYLEKSIRKIAVAKKA